ncbi:hypothetical protein CXB51_009704 [Gossypium anomalum]|uniref:RING-type E3 ubiquitin transferase n=1 Tax=Gossypium anomalum TaxID=47600 RepID=A0A8J5Z7R0_9ROSI|nr:hypothetical protein CXB51_009704 [Gossypium anomalum]
MLHCEEKGLVDCRKKGSLLSHGYDLHRVNNYVDIDDSCIYADHATDYYSTTWKFIIIVLDTFFVAIVHYQQHFGGRYFLLKRFLGSMIDEELPMDSEEQLSLKYST